MVSDIMAVTDTHTLAAGGFISIAKLGFSNIKKTDTE